MQNIEGISCGEACFVSGKSELFMLGSTLVLSFAYICYLQYCYYTGSEESLRKKHANLQLNEENHDYEEEEKLLLKQKWLFIGISANFLPPPPPPPLLYA